MNKTIPVLLLTGYLGSGKTTLLNRILSNRKGIRFAVIVNDIGEVNIDARLIQQGGIVGQNDDSLVALQNGCICCTLKMDLVQQLSDIAAMQKFDYIVIEASGICEPEPIAQTICSIPSMYPSMARNGLAKLDCVVTVVDAMRLQSEFGCGDELMRKDIEEDDLQSLVIQQIEFCNIILLNKISDVTREEANHIEAIIRAIQPSARIIECDYGEIDLDAILNTGLFDFESVVTSAAWIQGVENRDEHELENDEEGEADEYGIGTFVYSRRQPFDLNAFDNFVAKKWPKSVIRAKGMCYFSEEFDICYVFEQAGKQFSMRNAGQWYATMPPEELDEMMLREPELVKDWDPMYGDRMQKLVFIGQRMNREDIEAELDKCLSE